MNELGKLKELVAKFNSDSKKEEAQAKQEVKNILDNKKKEIETMLKKPLVKLCKEKYGIGISIDLYTDVYIDKIDFSGDKIIVYGYEYGHSFNRIVTTEIYQCSWFTDDFELIFKTAVNLQLENSINFKIKEAQRLLTSATKDFDYYIKNNHLWDD